MVGAVSAQAREGRRAWERIVSAGKTTPADLVAGAMRYGAERAGQDERYTKMPATWLNGECWLDEPAEPGPAIAAQRPGRPAQQSYTDISMNGIDYDDE
jgi:hypothetical protein